MKRTLFTLILLCIARVASAYEYHLQFTPPPGARALVVAGYAFVGNDVTGNCSYDTVSACSGRGCHSITTHHYNTCTWDLYGSLLSTTAGAPTVPTQYTLVGTEKVYATGGTSSTGIDTAGNFGFVSTPSSHYTWKTPNGSIVVIPDSIYSVAATFVSDGDFTLNINRINVAAQTYGTVTPAPGTAAVSGSSCGISAARGSTCTITISYDPTTIACTASPYGYAYTGIDLSLSTDAGGATTDFIQRFTVTGVPICDD